jgi:hypothetical protein
MRHPWPLLVLAVVLACGGEEHPAAPPKPLFASNDPKGDTLASTRAQARAHDVLHLEALRSDESLLVTVRFVHIVQPNSSRASNAVLGIVDIDIDDDPRTGLTAIADEFGATSRIGAEWSLFLEDSVAGPTDRRVALMRLSTKEVYWVPSRFDGTTVTASIPLALLDPIPAARVRMVGAVGNVERVSDIVPNEGSVLIEMTSTP